MGHSNHHYPTIILTKFLPQISIWLLKYCYTINNNKYVASWDNTNCHITGLSRCQLDKPKVVLMVSGTKRSLAVSKLYKQVTNTFPDTLGTAIFEIIFIAKSFTAAQRSTLTANVFCLENVT